SYSWLPSGGWLCPTTTCYWGIVWDGSLAAQQLDSADGVHLLTRGQATWTDYTVAADVKAEAGHASGVAGRVGGAGRFYALVLIDDHLQLRRVVGGSATVLKDVTVGASATFRRLTLDLRGH